MFSTARGSGLPSQVPGPHHCATRNQEEYLSVTEPQRLALYRAAQAALGEEEGRHAHGTHPTRQHRHRDPTGRRAAQALMKADIEHAQELMKADVAHAQALMDARTGQAESRMQTYVWKVVVGTGVALYLALAATMLAGFQFLS
jgi:hypothetical protein